MAESRPTHYQVVVTVDDGETTRVPGRFTAAEWMDMCDFASYAAELRRSVPPLKVELRVTTDESSGISFGASLPSEEHVSTLLHEMRPFVLEKEPTFVPKILNIVQRNVRNDVVDRFLDRLRCNFLGRENPSWIVTSGGVRVNSEAVLRKRLYGFEYHRDREKRAEIHELKGLLPDDWLRANFIDMMLDRAKVVDVLGKFVGLLTKERHVTVRSRRTSRDEESEPNQA